MQVNQLKISTRLHLLVGMLLTLMLLLGGAGLAGLTRADEGLQRVYERSAEPMALVAEIQERLLRNRLALAVALVTPDDASIARSVAEVEGNIQAISALWARYMARAHEPEERALAQQFAEHRQRFVSAGLLPTLAALKARDIVGAQRLVVEAVRPHYVAVGADIQALMQLLLRGAQAEHAQAQARHAGIRNLSIGLGLAGLLLALGLGRLLVRSIVGSLEQAIAASDAVARGDLTAQVDVRGGHEVARLLASLERMRASLAELVAGVRRDAEGVASASTQIAQGNSDLSSRTEQQASALQQTTASMEQLGSTVQQASSHARQADQLAREASEVAVRGGQMVAEVVQTMQGINESSRRIGEIIAVIDGLAFQTNILALNAAVEAARAGEQGRGFAVVAGEVRNLAQRSAQAAREIKQLILASLARVDQGSALVGQTGAAVAELVQAIHQVSAVVGGISAASLEQSAGVAQIGAAVGQMDRATQHNAALVEQTAAAAASLKQQARQLVQAVAVFRLGDAHGRGD
ncbi:methyl-accepting chemotaxis protein [Paucibacter soli]|uniref:methyl-accepting chemotaxis protein n=1 Tax=Paucibacter soli TaxID=3133433 RepID=UPI0030AFF46A